MNTELDENKGDQTSSGLSKGKPVTFTRKSVPEDLDSQIRALKKLQATGVFPANKSAANKKRGSTGFAVYLKHLPAKLGHLFNRRRTKPPAS